MRPSGRLALLLLLLVAPAPARAQFATNLLLNPSADDSLGSVDNFAACPAPHWSLTGTALVARWGIGSGFPDATSAGPAVRGANFFSGGSNAVTSTFQQSVDLSWAARLVDLGQVSLAIGGHFGGFAGQNDDARLSVQSLDGVGLPLGALTTPQVLAADRGGLTGMLYRTVSAPLPAGARSLVATLTCTRAAGTYDDGYADSLFVRLDPAGSTAVPPAVAGALRVLALSAGPAHGLVRFAVAAPEGAPASVQALDVQGRLLRAWMVPAGQRAELAWDGRDRDGRRRAGVCFVRARAGAASATLRLVLLD